MSQTRPWPIELKVRRGARTLEIGFDDGSNFSLPAEYLRVMTPSARASSGRMTGTPSRTG